MTPERWETIKQKILSSFEVTRQDLEKNEARREETEIIEFDGPLGQMKAAWIKRPKVLDKKTQYSNRIGSGVSVTCVYSPDEVTYTFKIYKWNELSDDWQEIKSDVFT